MTTKRLYKKSIYHTVKYVVKLVNYVSPKYAMNIYVKLLQFVGVKVVGRPRFISIDIRIDSFELLAIGERVVISEKVILLTHDYSCTTAFIAVGEIPEQDIAINRPIKIGNNVFIGMGSILMPGTTIEDNVIIGGGSVVRGQIPSDSIYIGNPGKIIGNIREYAEKCKSKIFSEPSIIGKGQKK
jgi:acetyltransferase-like isoleucine patch superfamily enzyme